jgi:hypothetical protein
VTYGECVRRLIELLGQTVEPAPTCIGEDSEEVKSKIAAFEGEARIFSSRLECFFDERALGIAVPRTLL